MPVMLAVMEIPGCLVALYLVSRLRHQGMDAAGQHARRAGLRPQGQAVAPFGGRTRAWHAQAETAVEIEKEMALEKMEHDGQANNGRSPSNGFLSPQLLHEVFLNPGLVLLFGGIIIGFVSGLQGARSPATTTTSSSRCSRASSACSCSRWG